MTVGFDHIVCENQYFLEKVITTDRSKEKSFIVSILGHPNERTIRIRRRANSDHHLAYYPVEPEHGSDSRCIHSDVVSISSPEIAIRLLESVTTALGAQLVWEPSDGRKDKHDWQDLIPMIILNRVSIHDQATCYAAAKQSCLKTPVISV